MAQRMGHLSGLLPALPASTARLFAFCQARSGQVTLALAAIAGRCDRVVRGSFEHFELIVGRTRKALCDAMDVVARLVRRLRAFAFDRLSHIRQNITKGVFDFANLPGKLWVTPAFIIFVRLPASGVLLAVCGADVFDAARSGISIWSVLCALAGAFDLLKALNALASAGQTAWLKSASFRSIVKWGRRLSLVLALAAFGVLALGLL